MAFCIECGQKLVDGAKFCSNCGKQVTQIQSDTTDVIDNVKVQTVKSKQSQNKQFSLFNNQIIFDGDLVSVIEVQKKFLEFAWDKRNKFVELYNSKINTLEDLFDIGLPQFISDIQEAVNLGVKTLMEYGVDYIDNGRLTDLASEDFDIENVWQPIFNEANIIDEEAERLATYRNVQRASRSRWQGGGFGIGGAIKGALTAGAMNIATGAFRGIGDSLTDSMEKAISETNRRRSIQEAYNEEHHIIPKTIKKSIRDSIKAIQTENIGVEYKFEKEEDIQSTISKLTDEMLEHASKMEFEQAAELRDKIKELEKLL